MKKIAILISGRGSNMEAIIAACARESWDARVACVISSSADAPGLEVAARQRIATEIVDRAAFDSRDAFETALDGVLSRHAPDCIALAGFMRVLSESFVTRHADRLLNVHPSLLPAFAGLDTHRRALAAGVRVHGATVHFVSPVVDAGPIVAQAVVPVARDDTAESLAARVLRAEHAIYPRAVHWFLTKKARLNAGRVELDASVAGLAMEVFR